MSFTPFASNPLILSCADLLPQYASRNTLPSAAVRNIKSQNETFVIYLLFEKSLRMFRTYTALSI